MTLKIDLQKEEAEALYWFTRRSFLIHPVTDVTFTTLDAERLENLSLALRKLQRALEGK